MLPQHKTFLCVSTTQKIPSHEHYTENIFCVKTTQTIPLVYQFTKRPEGLPLYKKSLCYTATEKPSLGYHYSKQHFVLPLQTQFLCFTTTQIITLGYNNSFVIQIQKHSFVLPLHKISRFVKLSKTCPCVTNTKYPSVLLLHKTSLLVI